MNFKKLQAMQKELDSAILNDKPEMTAEERFEKTCVALSVELAEVANCEEHFKFWKDNKGKVEKDRFVKVGIIPGGDNALVHDTICGSVVSIEQAHKLTLIEEASDCLHFILSLANQLNTEVVHDFFTSDTKELIYLDLQYNIVSLVLINEVYEKCNIEMFKEVSSLFFEYISKLGITQNELEQAYYDKHKINYERLENGY